MGPSPSNRGGMAAVIRILLDSPPAPDYDLEFVVTYRSPRPASRLLTFAAGLARLALWSLRPGRRIVHVHAAARGSLYRKSACVELAALARRPVLLHVHAGPGDIEEFHARIGRLRRLAFARAMRRADRVLAVSSATAAAVERLLGAREVHVVPNPAPPPRDPGRDAEGAGPTPSPPAARPAAREGAGGELLFLGGFANPAKGGATLAEAMPRILHELPGATLVAGGSGPPPDGLREAAGERLRWRGWLEDREMGAALARADVFLLPSRSEGLPMALLEAMAAGRAIVATRVGGVPEVLTHEHDALLVEPADAGALADAAIRLAGEPELRARLGAAAAERARRLNRDEVARRLDALYRELAEPRYGPGGRP